MAMDGKTVIVRLLDPLLHEFLDNPRDLAVELAHLEDKGAAKSEIAEKRDLLRRIDSMTDG